MTPHEQWTANELDHYLDAVLPGNDPFAIASRPPALATIDRLRELASRPKPDRAFVERLELTLTERAPIGLLAPTPPAQPTPAIANLPSGPAPLTEPVDRPRYRHWWPALEFAAAGLLVLITVGVYLVRDTDRSSQPVADRAPAGAAATPTPSKTPASIAIPKLGVDTPIQAIPVVEGLLGWSDGPWVAGWYERFGKLGDGNVVMVGHVDYWTTGPAVVYRLHQLEPGDRIEVVAADGSVCAFTVDWLRTFPADAAPDQVEAIVGLTGQDSLTLITERTGTWDPDAQTHRERLVVRATLLLGTGHAHSSPVPAPRSLDVPDRGVFTLHGTPGPEPN